MIDMASIMVLSPLFFSPVSSGVSVILPSGLLQGAQLHSGTVDSRTIWSLRLPELQDNPDRALSDTFGKNVHFVSGDGRNFFQTLISPRQTVRHSDAQKESRPVLTQTPQLGSLVLAWKSDALTLLLNHPEDPQRLLEVPMSRIAENAALEGATFYLAPTYQPPALEGGVEDWWKKRGEISSPLLVIDDEEMVRRAYNRILPRRGFRNIEFAASFEEGLSILQSCTDIHAVLSDFNLNDGKTGIELATRILAERNSLRFLFVSGRIGDLQSDLSAAGLTAFRALAKPVAADDLEAGLRALFEGL